jgi:hypothetical protein
LRDKGTEALEHGGICRPTQVANQWMIFTGHDAGQVGPSQSV